MDVEYGGSSSVSSDEEDEEDSADSSDERDLQDMRALLHMSGVDECSASEEEVPVRRIAQKSPRNLPWTELDILRWKIRAMQEEVVLLAEEEADLRREEVVLGEGETLLRNLFSQFDALREESPLPTQVDYSEELARFLEKSRLLRLRKAILQKREDKILLLEAMGQSSHPLHYLSALPDILTNVVEGPSVDPHTLSAMLRHLDPVALVERVATGVILLRTITTDEHYIFLALEAASNTLQAYIIIRRGLLRV
jgi:hypothetical protein